MSQNRSQPALSPQARATIAVDRAVAELRRGRPVLIDDPSGAVVALAAETIDDDGLGRLAALAASGLLLALTAERASVLHVGPTGDDTILLHLTPQLGAALVHDLADATADLARPLQGPFTRVKAPAGAPARGAIALCKLARLLPAAVIGSIADAAAARDLLAVTPADIFAAPANATLTLKMVGAARLPVAGVEGCRIVAFRPADGGNEHLALVFGEPPRQPPPLTRLHSQCFTGDLLASLRCDCGQQLRGAVATLATGGGILLYLAQEGRGIGLVNKLRAYRLQDLGFDTYEANRRLGFAADERLFAPAAAMLIALGYNAVRLLTNNPDKVAGLVGHGIDVVERVAHAFPPNNHNEAYLAAKKRQSGHYL